MLVFHFGVPLQSYDVIILGGGILGQTLSFYLSQQGRSVLVLEEKRLGGGATGNGFAWINATSKTHDRQYHQLNALGVAEYDLLSDRLGRDEIGLRIGGALFWSQSAESQQGLRSSYEKLRSWGYPIAQLSNEDILALEPNLRIAGLPDRRAEGIFAPADRWLNPSLLLAKLREQALSRGAVFNENIPVQFIEIGSGKAKFILNTESEVFTSSSLILATGSRTNEVLKLLSNSCQVPGGALIDRIPGLLVETERGGELIERVLYPPDEFGLHMRPATGGGILFGSDDSDKVLTQSEIPDIEQVANSLLRRMAVHLPEGYSYGKLTPRICNRAVPKDGLPLVGKLGGVGGLFLAVTHSGITLGPLLGRLLANEIISGRECDELAICRPNRG